MAVDSWRRRGVLCSAAPLSWAACAMAQPCAPAWSPLIAGSPDAGVEAIEVYNKASGPVLIIGGWFETVAGLAAPRIAQYAGGHWSALGSGIPGPFNSHGYNGCCARVSALARASIAGTQNVYIGGDFIQAGGAIVESVAAWDGTTWQSLAGGLAFSAACVDCPPRVLDLVPDQSQNLVYTIGSFEFAGGAPRAHIAAWDGSAFHPLGSGLARTPGELQPVWGSAGILFDDGAGLSLYVGGFFSRAGGVDAGNIARWDGQSWHALGAGITQPPGGPTPNINALAVFDDGAGPNLYAAGYFLQAGGAPARHIARWDGQNWSSLGAGLGTDPNDQVHALAVFDDGSGPALYAAGRFDSAGGLPAQNIALWRDQTWSSLGLNGSGVDGAVRALAVLNHGAVSALIVGGWFTSAGSAQSPYLAAWTGCAACMPNCDNSTVQPVLNVDDFTCFINEFAAAQALPHAQQIPHYANCDNSTTAPVLNVDDFTCFINAFAAGCP